MQEIAEYFRVGRQTVIRWQDEGDLPYRLKLTNRGRTRYIRVTDSLQFEMFHLRKLPQVHELDPTGSPTHRKLLRLRAKARRNSAAGLQEQRRRHDPTLRLVPPGDTGKTNPSPSPASGMGQDEPGIEPGEQQEADPYQGEGEGRSVAPRGSQDEREGVNDLTRRKD